MFYWVNIIDYNFSFE